MKTKFTKILILALSLLAITCFALACAPQHTHVYSEEYSFDKESHWFECDCGEDMGKEEHSFTDGVCECGYEEDDGEHEHSYPETYSFSDEFHWFECECGEKKAMVQHSFIDGKCSCSYEKKDDGGQTPTTPDIHVCVYNTVKSDESTHWLECECGKKSNSEFHRGGNATCVKKAKCDICTKEYGNTLNHNYSAIKFDNKNHWYECSCGDKNGLEEHIPGQAATETTAQKCTVCAFEVTPALGHIHKAHLTKVSKNEASCVAEGNKEYYSCSCGRKFWDIDAQNEINDSAEIKINKLDHEFERLKHDSNKHWYECSCGETDGEELHKGGTATCTEKAKCLVCGEEDGTFKAHNYSTLKFDVISHWYECECGEKSGTENHKGGAATCSKKPVCDECEQVYGELKEHQYTVKFDDDYHWDECEFGEKINKEAHYGGTATGSQRAICDKCEQPYGELNIKTVNLMMALNGYGTAWIEEIIEKFEELFADEGYKINLLTPSSSFGTVTALAEMRLGAKGSGYDLVMPGSVFAYDALDHEYGSCVECLDDVYASTPISFDGRTEAKSLNQKLTVDDSIAWMAEDIYNVESGERYGFFNYENVRGVVCNTDVLKTYAGITNFDEQYPRTSEEFFALFDAIMGNKDAQNSGVRPVIYGGYNAATYSVAPAWVSVAQILGKDEYNKQWSMEEFYAKNGNCYYADDWKYYIENEAILPTVEYIMQSWDYLYSVQGADRITHDVAHGQLMIDLAAFMFDGNYFYNEVRYGFANELDKIRMIPMPVVSYVGLQQELCGVDHNVGYGNNSGVKCDNCDKILSAIIKGIDEGKNLSTIKTQVQSAFSVSLTNAQVAAVYEARTCGYGSATGPAYILKDSEVKDVAKLFLRMLASEDAARIMEKYGMISAYSNPQAYYNTPTFLQDCYRIKNNQTWSVDAHNKPNTKRIFSWIPTFNATIGVQLHSYMPNDKTYKDRDYAKIAKNLFGVGGEIYNETKYLFSDAVSLKGLNFMDRNNPNANYHN